MKELTIMAMVSGREFSRDVPRILLVLFATLAGGCTAQKEAERPQGETPLHFAIILGSGGGFAGRYEGYYVDSLGAVSSWRGVTFGNSTRKEIGTLEPGKCAAIQDMITGDSLLAMNFTNAGNLTSFMTLASGAGEYRFSWEGTNPDNAVPAPVRALHSKILEYINTLTHQQSQ